MAGTYSTTRLPVHDRCSSSHSENNICPVCLSLQGHLNDEIYARLFVPSKWNQTKRGPSLIRKVRGAFGEERGGKETGFYSRMWLPACSCSSTMQAKDISHAFTGAGKGHAACFLQACSCSSTMQAKDTGMHLLVQANDTLLIFCRPAHAALQCRQRTLPTMLSCSRRNVQERGHLI